MTLRPGRPDQPPPPAAPGEAEIKESPIEIPDVIVYDQNGRKLSFYSDLVKGKTVAINFIFTTCTTICPPLTATMRRVQQQLSDGRENIQLISITVDPATDVPARLKSFAEKFGARPGWAFVTGNKTDIDRLLSALGAYVADPADHSPLVLIGNEGARFWTRSYGLVSPSVLTGLITQAADKALPQAQPATPGAHKPRDHKQ
jgi:cytochrome oxidase Cu insertion factor (SCO1/SenC/PrrC family)